MEWRSKGKRVERRSKQARRESLEKKIEDLHRKRACRGDETRRIKDERGDYEIDMKMKKTKKMEKN